MLIIPIKEGENIERALKRYKRKFVKTTVKNQLQNRKQYNKPSVLRRAEVKKAAYKEQLFKED
jgi:small subunit ribosomal protein S21